MPSLPLVLVPGHPGVGERSCSKLRCQEESGECGGGGGGVSDVPTRHRQHRHTGHTAQHGYTPAGTCTHPANWFSLNGAALITADTASLPAAAPSIKCSLGAYIYLSTD